MKSIDENALNSYLKNTSIFIHEVSPIPSHVGRIWNSLTVHCYNQFILRHTLEFGFLTLTNKVEKLDYMFLLFLW